MSMVIRESGVNFGPFEDEQIFLGCLRLRQNWNVDCYLYERYGGWI